MQKTSEESILLLDWHTQIIPTARKEKEKGKKQTIRPNQQPQDNTTTPSK